LLSKKQTAPSTDSEILKGTSPDSLFMCHTARRGLLLLVVVEMEEAEGDKMEFKATVKGNTNRYLYSNW
jgi:hypothetical protein